MHASPNSEAFFLAATLVETLHEHFASTPADKGSTCLCLCDLLPDPFAVVPLADTAGDGALGLVHLPMSQTFHPCHSLPSRCASRLVCDCKSSLSAAHRWASLAAICSTFSCLLPWVDACRRVPAVGHIKTCAIADFLCDLPAREPFYVWCFTDGSFYPPTAAAPACLGWACVFFHPHSSGVSWVADGVPLELHDPGAPLSAYIAECTALLAAEIISATALLAHAVHFRSDCQAALAVLQGPTQA